MIKWYHFCTINISILSFSDSFIVTFAKTQKKGFFQARAINTASIMPTTINN